MKKFTGLLLSLFLASQLAMGGQEASPLRSSRGGLGSTSVPTSGQIPIGNSGGTAYVPQSLSGGVTINSSGVATVQTNANLTGVITSSGNATSIASQTGTGSKFVVDTSPTIVTPTIAKLSNLTTNGYVKTSGGDGTLGVQTTPIPAADVAGGRTINAQSGTTYTFVLADGSGAGGFPLVTATNASAQTYTVPPNSSVAFPTSPATQIDICQMGAGKVTLAQGSGVTINSVSSNKSIGAQYACASLIKTATDTWLLVGNLAP